MAKQPAAQPAAKPAPKPPTKEAAAKATEPAKPAETTAACQDQKITVVIDPGHGDNYGNGVDSGTVYPEDKDRKRGQAPDAQEKDIALAVSKAIKDKLTGKPHVKAVILTREGDVTQQVVRFQWRKDVAKANDAVVFVSVHVNSSGEGTANGHTIYYFSPNADAKIEAESVKLATAMDKAYTTIGPWKGGAVIGQKPRIGLVAFGAPYPVKAGALAETGFIGNTSDRTNLTTKADAIGGELAEGIATYIKDNIATLCPKP